MFFSIYAPEIKMYFLKAPLEILRRLRVPETPPASVLCASHILNLVLSFATIPTSCLVRLLWTPGCFFLSCNPFPGCCVCHTLTKKWRSLGFIARSPHYRQLLPGHFCASSSPTPCSRMLWCATHLQKTSRCPIAPL